MLLPLLLLVIPAVVLAPNLGFFPFPGSGSPYSDIATTHYPNAVYLLRALKEWRTIPLWSPTILSGYPFVSHPLSGLFYPPGWLALLFPLPAGFTLVAGLHLVWGGAGMYRLMRYEGRSHAGAVFSGLAFASLPKIFAHLGAGHLTLVYAFAWLPWVLAGQAASVESNRRTSWEKWLPGFLIGLVVLADVRWGVFTWLVAAMYKISHSHKPRWSSAAYFILMQTIAAAITAAPLILLLWEFTELSTRSTLSARDALQYSLPILRLFGLIVPDVKNNHEWVVYPGALTVLLSLIGIVGLKGNRNRIFWGTLGAASLVFSLGANLPGLGQTFNLPVLNLLRVPARGLFLTDLSLCALAGLGLDRLLSGFDVTGRRTANLILFSIAFLAILLNIGISYLSGSMTIDGLLEPALMIVGYVWLTMIIGKKIPSRIWLAGLFCLSILGWVHLARIGIRWRDAKDVLSESRNLAQYIASESGLFRTYSPSYSLPQQTAIQFNLEAADGIDPMQLANYTSFMEPASGVSLRSYSVTLPPFDTGSPQTDNRESRPDAHLLGLLNVRYVLSAFEIHSEGLVLEEIIDGILIYRNEYQKPRAWVQAGLEGRDVGQIRDASVFWSPNHVEARASGPGYLVLSEVAYPGWKVIVDGQLQELLIYQDVLRAVKLSEGDHRVEFIFQPQGLQLGFVVWFAAVVVAGMAKLIASRKSTHR
jgi:hypothetical protein